jgi:phosphoesterase RecJ-like protein
LINPRIVDKIMESNKIAIMSHIMPDGDNVGSSLALYNALKKSGKDVYLILDDEIPKIYKFLKNSDKVERPGQYESFDAVIALDCGDAGRLGKSRLYLENNFVINIDHHISNDEFGDLNLVDSNAAATAEIIYQIIKILGIEMDSEIAECLYTAIVTDTGQFQYSNTTSETHQIIGDLIRSGVNVSLMFERIYQNSSKEKVMLMKTALDTLEFFHDDRISCISLTLEQMRRINAAEEDSDGIINLARDIECVEVAIFLKELEPGRIKVGLRSKKSVDVASVSLQFGGGGHVRAAGCTLNGTIEDVKAKVLDAVIAEF